MDRCSARGCKKWQLIAEDFFRLIDPEHQFAKALAAQQSPQQIRQSFAQMTVEELSQLPIGNISMVLGRGFVIPENLRCHFTFPERPPIEDAELWTARENPEPWQMLLFRLLSHRAPSSLPDSSSGSSPDLALRTSTLETELPEFRRALREIADFAQRQAPAFEEAFRCGFWISQPTRLQLNNCARKDLARSLSRPSSDRTLRIYSQLSNCRRRSYASVSPWTWPINLAAWVLGMTRVSSTPRIKSNTTAYLGSCLRRSGESEICYFTSALTSFPRHLEYYFSCRLTSGEIQTQLRRANEEQNTATPCARTSQRFDHVRRGFGTRLPDGLVLFEGPDIL
jgi:hypothetical protein